MTYCLIQTYPVRTDIGPYLAIVVNDAQAHIQSIYRGSDAEALLNKYGHHSQRQLYEATPQQRADWGVLGTPNRPGFSTHELYSDGVAFPQYRAGASLPWWCQGMDVLASESDAVIAAGQHWGWDLFRPYSSGVEIHHLCLRSQPKRPVVGSALWRRLWRLRFSLPRS